MKSALPLTILAVFLATSGVQAGEARIISITDEASPLPAASLISEYRGLLPPTKPGRLEIPQMHGFPTVMGGSANFSPSRGLVFADLNGDEHLEIITSSTDKKIYAWDDTGEMMPGFPVTTIEMPQYAPSVEDMDGDGDMEIVQFTRGMTSGGRLYVLDHLGNVLPGFPLSVNNNNLASCPTLYDLDDDGVMEIIAGERAYPIGYLHIFELDATEWTDGWPVELDHVPTGTAAVGDVDDDGSVEIFYMSYNSMYLVDLAGHALPGWPKQIPSANFSYQSAALADLDDDGDLEIVVGAHKDAAGCYVFHHDGTTYPGWPKYLGTWTYCAPTVTDLEGDGELEILDGRAGYGPGVPSNCFWAWTSSGAVKPGFPFHQTHGGGSEGPLTVADVNGDGLMEIFADHNIAEDGAGYLFGVDSSGNELPGFPLRPRGFTYMNGAAIGDVDGDGDYELGVLSSHTDDTGVDVNLYDLPDIYSPTDRDWKVYHARNRRGGLYPAVDEVCPADFDGDGDVDTADLLFLLGAWGTPDGDVDGDGDTDTSDLLALLAAWGECP